MMFWLLVLGCIVIIGVVIAFRKNSNQTRLPSHRDSAQLPNTSSIRWQDIPRSSSHLSTPIVDQSSIVWQELSSEATETDTEEDFSLEFVLDENDIIEDSLNHHKTFLDPDHNPTIQELLKSVIGARDILTQEEFLPGQQVYFCSNCTLAHHEDSWKDNGNKCSECESDEHTQLYTLPQDN